MKKAIIALVLAAVAVWAVWYFVIREPTVGEKIDDGARKVEESVKDAIEKIAP